MVKSTAEAIKSPPMTRRISCSDFIGSISLKINKEKSMARGTTALLKAARVPGFVFVAPLFQRKKPKPEATSPR